MWQSWVQIELYYIVQFDQITGVEALYHNTSIMGGVHMCCVNS